MPTLYNGYSTKRLFRYYDAVLRKRPQSVMEGDDTSVPNVILSYRKALSPGEWMYFEAVNVPDGSRTGNIEVSLELVSPEGKTLAVLPATTLREDALDAAELLNGRHTLWCTNINAVQRLWRHAGFGRALHHHAIEFTVSVEV